MKQSNLSVWLKSVLIVVALWASFLYIWLLPHLIRHFLQTRVIAPLPEVWYMVFAEVTGLPCIAVLALAWSVAVRIGRGRSFSIGNAKAMMWIAYLLFGDAVYFFLGNAVLFAIGKSAAVIMMLALFVCVAVMAVTVAFAVLSHLISKASRIETENALTV